MGERRDNRHYDTSERCLPFCLNGSARSVSGGGKSVSGAGKRGEGETTDWPIRLPKQPKGFECMKGDCTSCGF